MSATTARALGRAAFDREAWAEACAHLRAADQIGALEPDDLDRLATAAYLVGDDAASADARARAHTVFLERGEPIRAARSAFWLAFVMFDRPGRQAQAGGWLARAVRLIDEASVDCAEKGFCLCASARQKVGEGDVTAAHALFREAAEIGMRFHDPDLTALARHGEGRTLLRMDRSVEGLARLDEVMVAVTCGEVAPMMAGVLYCSVISACYELFDLRRAREWTSALAGWCATHPDMVPFRGHCLTRRSELLQMHGDWQEAVDEARRACTLLRPADQADAGAAHYQLAEMHRLRGEFEQADVQYRLASQTGYTHQPGLALLRLAQGQVDAGSAALRHVLQESRNLRVRTDVLRASVEIALVAGELVVARSAADELTKQAQERSIPFLRAASAHASGAVALAAGEVDTAAARLREAWTTWQELGVPYEVARVRALLGLAYRKLGDEDGSQMELEAAQETFERLGAAPDAERVAALVTPAPVQSAGPLTGREVEVLRLVATGKTNRAIAEALTISEKTVARHVSNIFTKLDLSSRSAATAYAYNHKLL
jgi:DNA-binding CsgD family transcriptional regulator